jgi:hypothetical protein
MVEGRRNPGDAVTSRRQNGTPVKHLHEIKGRYAVRIAVPPDLRGIIGRNELLRWLGPDRKIAERSAGAVIGDFLTQIEQAREKLTADATTIRTAAGEHYAAELLADDRERTGPGVNYAAVLRKQTGARRASLLRLVAAGQVDGEEAEALLGWAADALHEAVKAPAGIDRRALLKALAKAQLEALARFDERDEGKGVPTPPSGPTV